MIRITILILWAKIFFTNLLRNETQWNAYRLRPSHDEGRASTAQAFLSYTGDTNLGNLYLVPNMTEEGATVHRFTRKPTEGVTTLLPVVKCLHRGGTGPVPDCYATLVYKLLSFEESSPNTSHSDQAL